VIISASYRTDIPAYYGEWFMARLRAGAVIVVNPYGGPPYRVGLAPGEAEGIVFWTKNLAPFARHLSTIRALGFPFYVQFTVTGYPRPLEPRVPRAEEALAQIGDTARRFGSRAVVWRYDPVLFTSLTPPEWHVANFDRLARALAGRVDEVTVSFAFLYRKTRARLARVARAAGISWRDPDDDEKRAFMARLAALAAERGLTATLCTGPFYRPLDMAAARCVDAARLSDVAGRPIAARVKGNRPGCFCAESRDIGAYDTCAQGCVYCYAVASPLRARQAVATHDPGDEQLAP
jgi:hypothetical protein